MEALLILAGLMVVILTIAIWRDWRAGRRLSSVERARLRASATALDRAARHGLNSPQYRAAKAAHAQRCKELDH